MFTDQLKVILSLLNQFILIFKLRKFESQKVNKNNTNKKLKSEINKG